MHGSLARIAVVLVALTALGLNSIMAEDTEPCCEGEDLGPGELQPGIFDCCPDCRETRIYRSEILGRLWVRGELLGWAMKGQAFPPLVTASLPGTAPQDTGVLGRLGTGVLFGNDEVGTGIQPGGRLTGGFWFHPNQMTGIEGNYFELDNAQTFFAAGRGALLVARPYLNVNTLQQSSLLVQYPGIINGSVTVDCSTTLNGAEALLRHVVRYSEGHRIDVLAGYRYSRLEDELSVLESLDPVGGPHSNTFDWFDVENQFHGAEVGAIGRWHGRYVGLQLLGKIALGTTSARFDIDGGTDGLPGSLLALPSNIGSYRHSEFSAVGELGVSLEVALTCNCRATLGYTLIYWPNVARVADQLDLGVNPTQFPGGQLAGAARPAFEPTTTSFWAQGLTAGLEYQF